MALKPILATVLVGLSLFAVSEARADDDAARVPPGYHLETRLNLPLVLGGVALSALSVPLFTEAKIANDYTAKTDLQELKGPYLDLGGVLCAAGGLTLIVLGLSNPREHLVRDDVPSVRPFFAPVLGAGRGGFTTGVVF
ncbi:MAG TPA: hypothetical protein VNW92_30245 [Polyangiaceae bacterium]|jgi:hypothetical protein|nr:hypothetical protein [Polyangiaceae bacterium]